MEDAAAWRRPGLRDLFGDASRSIDEVHEGNLQPLGGLLDAHDLLNGARPPRPALTVGSLAVTAHVLPCMTPMPVTTPAAASSGSSGTGNEPVLDKVAAGVEETRDSFARQHLVLGRELVSMALRAPARARSSRS